MIALGVVLTVGGFAGAAWVVRWEIRYQLRSRRRGGFMVGGDR